MKKIATLLLAFVMSISNVYVLADDGTASAVSKTLQTADGMSEVGILKILGIIDEETEDVNNEITREDFAVGIARMLDIQAEESSVRYFSDVEQSGYAVGAINSLVERGIISQAVDKKFRPMENVTAQEAIKMLICTLGYGDYAEVSGGFPGGYMEVAKRLEITDGIILGGEFTKKSVYMMMYNALHTNMYTADGVDGFGNVIYSESCRTLMGEYHNVYRYEGTVTAVHGQNMGRSAMPSKDNISIDGVLYAKDENLNVNSFFGSLCKIWFYGDPNEDDGTVIYLAELDKAAETIVIESHLYDGYTGNEITYFLPGTSGKTNKINIKSANFIYNGIPLLSDYESTLKNINKGSITVKDSDGDDYYDLVIIEDYKNFVVSTVSADTVYNKINTGESISFENYKTKNIYAAAGNEIDYSEIISGNVLAVAESKDKDVIKVIVSTTEISQKATLVSPGGEDMTIIIEGNEYAFDRSYYKSLITENGGLKYNFLAGIYYYKLDHMNKVCWVDTDSTGMKLGYILNAWEEIPSLDDTPIRIEVFTSTNESKRYECAKNVRVDGVRKKHYSDFVNAFPNTDATLRILPQVIRYSVNAAGEISAIDTSNYVKGAETEESSMIARYDKAKTMWYNSGRLGVATYVDANTPVFYVPEGEDRPRAADIYCGSYSFLMVTDEKYCCNSYRFGTLTMRTGAVVCEYAYADLPKNRNHGAKVVMFDSLGSGVNSDDEIVQIVKGYSAGAKVELQVPTDISLEGIECGDIIRFYYDINGNVSNNIKTGLPDMEIICKRSDIYKNNSPGWTNNSKYPNLYSDQTSAELSYYRASIQFSYGFVNRIDGTLIGWGYNDGSTVDEIANIPGSIVIYDSTQKERNRIKTGTVADITDYVSAGDDCSRIIYHTRGGGYVETFIYK